MVRLSGLASGMDTDTLVKNLMKAERMPVDRLKQQQQRLEWQSESYRNWNTELFTFRTKTLFDMKLSGSYNTFDVSSSISDSVTATSTADAIPGTYNMTVHQLAKSATFQSNNVNIDATKTLGDAAQGVKQLSADSTFSIKVYNDPTNPTSFKTANITISPGDTIYDAVGKFNNAKDSSGNSLGIQAIYDNNLQQFIVKTKSTGAATKIEFGSDAEFLDKIMGVSSATTSLITSGQDASVTFNGTTVNNLSSNTVTLLGVNYTLKSPTVDSSGNPTSTTITVNKNIDDEVKNIKNFIEKYNELLDKMHKAIDEPVYKSYQPLTDEQRETLSEKQIEQWEEKAKSGLLRRDPIVSDLVNKMRSFMSTTVDNGSEYNSLASIGIKSNSYQDKGKLYIDEDKLKKALQEDPDAVQKLFSQSGDTINQKGLVNRLYDEFSEGIKKLTEKAGVSGNSQYDQSRIGKILNDSAKRINRMEEMLIRKEDSYYRRFTAMEKAMSTYNSQSSWLMQQFGGGF